MEKALRILEKLEQEGCPAYIVGGAVRDMLLGNDPEDIDIVALATPVDILAAARIHGWATHEVGAAFGVVVVVVEGEAFEVASARKENYGLDSHRPEEVSFVRDIKEDLARRDFTINAMAMDSKERLIDPFGGQEDLIKKTIRAVGDPVLRFREDGLRPFRAIRFAAKLGFEIEKETLAAIPGALPRVSGLSVERVRMEMEKILQAPFAAKGLDLLMETGLLGCSCVSNDGKKRESVSLLPELEHLKGLQQNPRYHHFDAWRHTLEVVANVPPELELRWAALLHDCAKGLEGVRCLNRRGELADHGHDRVGAEIAARILSRLKVPRSIGERAAWLVRHHMTLPEGELEKVKKWLVKRAPDFSSKAQLSKAVGQLLLLRRADIAGGKVDRDFSQVEVLEGLVERVLGEMPLYVSELALQGGMAAKELGAGPQVKEFLEYLLMRVQQGGLPNKTEALLKELNNKGRKPK